jgi:hypothetical protein
MKKVKREDASETISSSGEKEEIPEMKMVWPIPVPILVTLAVKLSFCSVTGLGMSTTGSEPVS